MFTPDYNNRIVGYYTPTNLWNKGKVSEFSLRHVQSNLDMERAATAKEPVQ
jgi:hypothetical protein